MTRARKPAAKKVKERLPTAAEITREVKKPGFVVTDLMLERARENPELSHVLASAVFARAKPPPGVVPAGKATIAMDEEIGASITWAAQAIYNGAFVGGITFLGYPYLAELTQRAEYRRVSEVIATEMTRKWIKIQGSGDQAASEETAKKVKELTAEMERLDCQQQFKRIAEQDGFFGRAHLYIGLKGAADKPAELVTPIGDGQDDITKLKVKKGSLERLKTVEAVWCYPANYNSNDPLQPNWYKPDMWFVQGKEVHASRLLFFVGREVPDLLKPAYSFGGLSLLQMVKPCVDFWLRTRQSVSDIIYSFSVFVLKTNLGDVMATDGSQLFKRVDFFNKVRNNRGLMVLDKDSEEFENISAPLASLDTLQAQSQEHICSVSGIPLVKYTGISPAGLNASSEGEIRVFYDWIRAYQEAFFRPNLTRVFHLAQMNLWGVIDPDLTFAFEELWSLDDLQMATKRKTDMDTDVAAVGAGILNPEESRERIAHDVDGPYPGLNVSDVPEIATEEDGLDNETNQPET